MKVSWLSNFCFGILKNLTQIKRDFDKRNRNELFVSGKYDIWIPLLTTVVLYKLLKQQDFASQINKFST